MGPHYLNRFFNPTSVAIVGATERKDSVGHQLMLNMIEAGFKGNLYPINHKRDTVMEYKAYPSLTVLPEAPDLVVIATPAATVPELMHQAGEKGVKSVVVITAGFSELGEEGTRLEREILDIARRFEIRIIGPNCLGIIRPSAQLNATFGYGQVADGSLALVSQSGAVCTAILDWAQEQGIGFSTVVSTGAAADIDFGEILDYLALDPKTHSILLYVEGIRDARRFISGLKAAARLKPMVLIKSGRHEAGTKAAMSHTGAMVGNDDVFDAAIERAGVVRVYSIAQLFAAARVLANHYEVRDDRLAIITNAGGPGVMSTDRAGDVGIPMAELEPQSLEALNKVLPAHWSRANPVDILGDATPERYRQALDVCLQDKNISGVLVILMPQAMTNPTRVAELVIEAAENSNKPVLASWTGGERVHEAQQLFGNTRVAHFNTPEMGVDAFSFLAKYTQNQKLLRQTPAPNHEYQLPDVEGARLIMERVLAEGRHVLDTQESKALLKAFKIPTTQTIRVTTAKEAMIAAESLGMPVVLKVNMPEFSHKSDIGGVRLNINSIKELSSHFQEMEQEVRKLQPGIDEVVMTVEPMYRTMSGREMMLGVVRDPVFGPAISFGLGGTMVEILRDKSVALPPINEYMAERMIAKTRAARYLGPFRQMPAANTRALVDTLINLSTMLAELPEIQELDINPLIVDEHGVIAVDARIQAGVSHQVTPYAHMAIHPYPAELTEHHQLPNGQDITIRPIRAEDAAMEEKFVKSLSEQSRYFRFMQALHELTPEMLVRFTQIDYDREMAFVAVHRDLHDACELGVGRYILNPDGSSAEFALVVADEVQGMGIGTRIMKALIHSARLKGVEVFEGEVLAINKPMLNLVNKLGFTVERSQVDDDVVHVVKDLRA